MEARAMAIKVIRIGSGAGLIALGTFWVVILIKVIAGLAAGGVDGARGNLHRMLLENTLWEHVRQDPLVALSRCYETIVLCLLITWALREIYGYARRRTTRVHPETVRG
jgi:hypothetical protein